MRMRSAVSAVSTRSKASWRVVARGFSQRTCLPAWSAAFATTWCVPGGEATAPRHNRPLPAPPPGLCSQGWFLHNDGLRGLRRRRARRQGLLPLPRPSYGPRYRVLPGLRGRSPLLLWPAGIAVLEPGDLFWGQHYGASVDVGTELLARVATDKGEDLQWLSEDVGQRDLRHGQPFVPGENAGALEAPEVLLVAVGFYTDPVEGCVEGVQVIAGKAAGEETTREARPGKQRHPGLLIPMAAHFVCADAHAVGPGLFGLHGEAEVGAAGDHGCKAARPGVVVRFAQALGSPVRAAESMDPAFLFVLVEDLNDGADRDRRVVAVEEV